MKIQSVAKYQKNFENSLTVPKTREGGPFGLFETSVCCKISKNLKGDRLATKEKFEFLKKIQKKRKMRILKVSQCRKTRKGDPLGFLKLQFAAKYQKNLKGGPFGDKRKFEKKSHSAEKKSKGGPCSPVRFCILR